MDYSTKLVKEITDISERIISRQSEIEKEIILLNSKITFYTNCAWIFVYAGAAITFFSVIFYIFKNKDTEFELNLLGDFLGGSVASIWSLAGLFLIYVAFLGQKQQLLNQQLEIMYSQLEVKYTRLELAGQREEMATQNDTLLNQKFENTFFQLLTLFNGIVNSLDLRNGSRVIISSGRDCFKTFYNSLRAETKNAIGQNTPFVSAPIIQTIKAYDKVYNQNKSDLSHYFRTIYHIFKFIDDSTIENKKRYASIVRAQLSSYEQVLLFYNCIHSNGLKKFKPLIEQYAILKNLDEDLILSPNHLNEYEPSARGLNS
ncbi:putative phage abortive infection protein [Mangrovimonas sp. TPBH4]|uniref:putative phage abortive infection protein n=1 Tax=Mangrovimonas sp. TPBH4 TaxID=1645914 RepID=UPI0006B64640|nr:putative phage abortive infection protein [Mangrovimonas sp. TPBH4]